mgnify:CR=1 FL=1
MGDRALLAIVGLTLGLMSLGVGLEVYLVIRALERADAVRQQLETANPALARRIEKFTADGLGLPAWLKSPDLLVVDEAHHAIADSYRRLLGYFDAKVLGGWRAVDKKWFDPSSSIMARIENPKEPSPEYLQCKANAEAYLGRKAA